MKKGRQTIIIILVILVCSLIVMIHFITPQRQASLNGYSETDFVEASEIETSKIEASEIESSEIVTEQYAEMYSIRRFLEIALEPVGSAMYIWGGGWNEEDTGAGITTTQIGLYPMWKDFADAQDETYNHKDYRFELEKGLDCSGYVGWVMYNTFETENGNPGYVTISTDMAASFAEKGWGTLIENPTEFLPGDVVSMKRHVWICLGTCADGSVLLVHSSPPGVSVCGTELSKNKKEESIATQLATEFMTTYYPKWQERYSKREVSSSYLENVSVFRWNESTMPDASKMQNLSAEEIIAYLSPGI